MQQESKDILKDYIDKILDFHKSRELRTDTNFTKLLSKAYEVETNDKRTAASILQNCQSCIARAIDFFANLLIKEQDSKRGVEEIKPIRNKQNSSKRRNKHDNR